jgi:hypothetical protein
VNIDSADTRTRRLRTVTSWLVCTSEPLVPLARRAAAEAALADLAAAHPAWAQAWFAGLVSSQMGTLPSDDPWRALSVHMTVGSTGLRRGPSSAPGVHGRHGPFGSVDDGTDLAGPAGGPAGTDVGLVALADGLEQEAGALLAYASDGWRAAWAVTAQLGRSTARVGTAAASWAMWRRRAYTGGDDGYATVAGIRWASLAETVVSGADLDDAVVGDLLAEGQVPGSWAEETGWGSLPGR